MLDTKYKDLMKLTPRKRMMLADELWASATDLDAPPTEQQKRVIQQRWDNYKSGKTEMLALKEFEARVEK
jgi:putative addiction module component (TIGR02574 family)